MKTAMALLAVLCLAACGGSDEPEMKTGADVATAAGCSGYKADEAQMFTRDTGACMIDGKDIYVMTFADEKARDDWFGVAKSAGASGSFGKGETWVIQGDDRSAVEKGTKAAGGEMEP